jgi:hypothetical protein
VIAVRPEAIQGELLNDQLFNSCSTSDTVIRRMSYRLAGSAGYVSAAA